MENRDSVVANLERLRDELKSGAVRTTVGASGVVRRMDWLDDAITMLRLQEPVMPGSACSRSDGEATWWHVCGFCGTDIDPNDKYCRQCGHEVKWE